MEVSNQEDFVVWSDPDCADACMLSEEERCPSTSNDRVALGDVTAQFQDFYMKVDMQEKQRSLHAACMPTNEPCDLCMLHVRQITCFLTPLQVLESERLEKGLDCGKRQNSRSSLPSSPTKSGIVADKQITQEGRARELNNLASSSSWPPPFSPTSARPPAPFTLPSPAGGIAHSLPPRIPRSPSLTRPPPQLHLADVTDGGFAIDIAPTGLLLPRPGVIAACRSGSTLDRSINTNGSGNGSQMKSSRASDPSSGMVSVLSDKAAGMDLNGFQGSKRGLLLMEDGGPQPATSSQSPLRQKGYMPR